MIRLADSDGNGKVSFVEFRNMMQMLNSKKHVEVAKTVSTFFISSVRQFLLLISFLQ